MFEKNKKFLYPIVLFVLFAGFFASGFFVGKIQVVCKSCALENIDMSLFWDSYNKLQENFIDPAKLDNQKIVYGAIEGMTKSLGDPYTDFFNPEQAKLFNSDLAGSFEGIGAVIGIKKNQLTVISPLEKSPAENAGIKAGDSIIKINGKDAGDMTTDEAVNLIRGPKGTNVTLTIFREGFSATKDFKITRATIKIDSVKWELKGTDVAYIKINQFDQPLSEDFKKIAIEIINSSAQKIVLDLRNNPGGYLETSQEIAGWFMQRGETVTVEDFGKNKPQTIYKTQGNASLADYPIVILINEGSASASEILAGALRDNRNIKLIGQKSFGKGSVQQVVDLSDGSFLKITIAKWLTPKGSSISEVGLSPDIKVEMTDLDIESKKDPQLDKALEIIAEIK
jgi:carboxyl-terminal processing protease